MTDSRDLGRIVTRGLGALVTAVGGVLLVLGAFAGFSVRPAADDWCIAAQTRVGGVGGMIHYFYDLENGRFANGLISGLAFSHGVRGLQILPALIAISITGGVLVNLELLRRMARVRVSRISLGAAATASSALMLFAGPVTYQVFFWAAGSISHTVPTALMLWTSVMVLLVEHRGSRRVRPAAVGLVLLVGFLIGSLSEAFVAVSGVYVAGALAWLWMTHRTARPRMAFRYGVAWLVGLVAGFAMLYTSPGRAARQAEPIDQPGMFSPAGLWNLMDQFGHTWAALLHRPAYLGAVAVGILVGASADIAHSTLAGWSRRRVAAVVGWASALLMLASLGVIVELRVGYGSKGWLYERAWENFMLPYVATLALLGALLGHLLRRTLRGAVVTVAVTAAALVGAVALAGLVPGLNGMAQELHARSIAWDAENLAVDRAVARGKATVAFTPLRIANLSEPFTYVDYERDWVADCVAGYYGATSLRPSRAWLRSPASTVYRAYHPFALN